MTAATTGTTAEPAGGETDRPFEAGPIPRTMRALVKAEPAAGAEMREVPVPRPAAGEVLIRVEAASLCGTDLHIYRWDPWAQERLTERLPQIFGHEMAGRIVALGDGANASGTLAIGTRVAAETHLVDGTCYQCRTGRAYVCANLRILGVDADGAFAEYMTLPAGNAWPSNDLSPEIAAIQEPMGNAVHAAFVEEVTGETVLVTGCGPIGLMSIAIAKLAGATKVIATDINPERRRMATSMGADLVLDAAGDVVAQVRAATGGVGRVSLLGLPSRPVTLDLNNEIIFKGLRVYGITGRRMFETWYRTQALLAQGLDLSPIVTHRLPLTRFHEAFELLAAGHAGKVVLLPQEA
jgi:threonine 3-dehydrogenase